MANCASAAATPPGPVAPAFRLGHRPALDGLRGVAILLVLFEHLELVRTRNILAGFIGVDLFFVLSGFLITCLLLEEHAETGVISLRNFYCRRALRLLPALILMLAAFLAYAFLMDPHAIAMREFFEALRALFYFTNWAKAFRIGHTLFLEHTWSLSMEEQFYILWPLLLLLLLRRSSRSSIFSWVALAAILSWFARAALFLGGTQTIAGNVYAIDPARIYFGLDTRADALLVGCAAGVATASSLLPQSVAFRRALKIAAAVAIIGLVLLGFTWYFNPWVCCLGWFFISVFGAIVILQVFQVPTGPLARTLAAPPLVYVGKISYGLYLWHFPIFQAMQLHFRDHWRTLAVVATVAATLLSYYLIERPCLRLKRKFERVK